MQTTRLTGLKLEDLLPHRGSMLLIDEVLDVDSTFALTSSAVRAAWPMAGAEGVPPLILIELAAQAAGVCNGWDRIQTKGVESDQMGYLVAIKRARFYLDDIPIDSVIVARAENTHNFENLREVFCALHLDDRLIGEVTLQLYQA